MTPTRPTLDDVPALAAMHVQAWQQSYAGLLPQAEIDRFDHTFRVRMWTKLLARDDVRVAWLDGMGFAAAGPQREDDWTRRGYPQELYAIYLLEPAKGQGLGRALFDAVRGPDAFNLWVLEGNDSAITFYERMGGRRIATRDEKIGEAEICEHAYGWDAVSASDGANITD